MPCAVVLGSRVLSESRHRSPGSNSRYGRGRRCDIGGWCVGVVVVSEALVVHVHGVVVESTNAGGCRARSVRCIEQAHAVNDLTYFHNHLHDLIFTDHLNLLCH